MYGELENGSSLRVRANTVPAIELDEVRSRYRYELFSSEEEFETRNTTGRERRKRQVVDIRFDPGRELRKQGAEGDPHFYCIELRHSVLAAGSSRLGQSSSWPTLASLPLIVAGLAVKKVPGCEVADTYERIGIFKATQPYPESIFGYVSNSDTGTWDKMAVYKDITLV
jgi:hypothetical protein